MLFMTKDYYPHLYEDWIRDETEKRSGKPYAKPFVGDRAYRHFDARISLRSFQTGESKLIGQLKNPDKVESHSFYPFIRSDKKYRRIKKVLYTVKHHRKLAIIDEEILWEGSLNILSQGDSCEIMRRTFSDSLALQMLHFTKLDKLATLESR